MFLISVSNQMELAAGGCSIVYIKDQLSQLRLPNSYPDTPSSKSSAMNTPSSYPSAMTPFKHQQPMLFAY